MEGAKDAHKEVLKGQKSGSSDEETSPGEALDSSSAAAALVERFILTSLPIVNLCVTNEATGLIDDPREAGQENDGPDEHKEDSEAERDPLEDVGDLSGNGTILREDDPEVGSQEDELEGHTSPETNGDVGNDAQALEHRVGDDAAHERAAAAARSWLRVFVDAHC